MNQTKHDPTSLGERLKALLTEYLTKARADVAKAKAKPLELHVTSRQIYEQQIEAIEDLLELLDIGEEISQ